MHVGCKATMTTLRLDGACPLFTMARPQSSVGYKEVAQDTCANTSQPWEVTAL